MDPPTVIPKCGVAERGILLAEIDFASGTLMISAKYAIIYPQKNIEDLFIPKI